MKHTSFIHHILREHRLTQRTYPHRHYKCGELVKERKKGSFESLDQSTQAITNLCQRIGEENETEERHHINNQCISAWITKFKSDLSSMRLTWSSTSSSCSFFSLRNSPSSASKSSAFVLSSLSLFLVELAVITCFISSTMHLTWDSLRSVPEIWNIKDNR